jgi:hypothetical protein
MATYAEQRKLTFEHRLPGLVKAVFPEAVVSMHEGGMQQFHVECLLPRGGVNFAASEVVRIPFIINSNSDVSKIIAHRIVSTLVVELIENGS